MASRTLFSVSNQLIQGRSLAKSRVYIQMERTNVLCVSSQMSTAAVSPFQLERSGTRKPIGHYFDLGKYSGTVRLYRSLPTDKNLNCVKCSHSYKANSSDFLTLVMCPNCGMLQKINAAELPNYFEILGQDQSYRVDLQSVMQKTKQLQKKFHPDLFGQKSSDQQELSQEYSSLINKALWTLSDPISRGRYMLSLLGYTLDDSGSDLEKTMTTDPEFLEEVMELNERLAEISSEQDWKDFKEDNKKTLKEIHGELEVAFEKGDLKEAHRLLGRMKYFDSLQDKVKELQSRIGIVE